MYKVSYQIGSTIVESFVFHNKALAKWKKKQLQSSGTHNKGIFTIKKV